MTIAARAMTGAERMLAACHRQPTDATPVWFMRQAGRSLADYRKLREQYPILTLAKTPELCTQITLMPVNELGVDGAVLFADIMLPLEGMGVSLEIQPDLGPVIHHPIRDARAVAQLRPLAPDAHVPFVLETIGNVRQELNGKAAVIGFCGAPFTLACYLIEGRPSRDYAQAKTLMLRQPDVWAQLMDRLTEGMIGYLTAQVQAGADVIQVFDSWVGALAPTDYEQSVLPWMKRIFSALRQAGAPTIYFGTGNVALLEAMATAGSDLLSIDWRVRLDDAWRRIGYDRGIQGNLDPIRPLAGWPAAEHAMREVLSGAAGRPGHIFNLGHGVMPETDPDVLRRLVDAVHSETSK
ncbi:MAG TPA: uroporphyrinogen decarboxylase [Chloroflexota bacterium]|jgi:uroporphyrinogen decarboxylase|nr:uroporphyrinogen decarboxylase [Chloroflexota bacterium]